MKKKIDSVRYANYNFGQPNLVDVIVPDKYNTHVQLNADGFIEALRQGLVYKYKIDRCYMPELLDQFRRITKFAANPQQVLATVIQLDALTSMTMDARFSMNLWEAFAAAFENWNMPKLKPKDIGTETAIMLSSSVGLRLKYASWWELYDGKRQIWKGEKLNEEFYQLLVKYNPSLVAFFSNVNLLK